MDDIRIYSQQEVDDARKRGEARLGHLTSDQIKHLRIKAKNDLFFLAYGVLGYDKLDPVLHLDFCRWLEKTRNSQFRLSLLPRSHFKSTIETITDSIQIALPDDLGTSIYPRNLGFNVRILISHEIDGAAQVFLGAIRNFIYQSEVLLALFPEITPTTGRTDNKTTLELNRDRVWPEATFTTMGVGGKRQGSHFDYIKADDLQGESATFSKSELASTKQWVDNLQSYLLTPASDHIDFVGTRWAHDDVWAHIMKMYEDSGLVIYHRAVEEWNAERTKKIPIFPAQYDRNGKIIAGFTEQSLAVLRKNRRVWTGQYLNNPSEGAGTFEESHLRYWNWYRDRRHVAIFSGDDSDPTSIYDLSDLDKVIFIDPAMTGNFGIAITGTTHKGQHIVLESIKREFKQPEFVDWLFMAVQKWQPRLVVIEGVLFSHLYQHWLVREMSSRHTYFKVEASSTRQKAKEERITGLAPYFAASTILFHQEQDAILKEYREFGASDDIHILDALAYGPEYWRNPPPPGILISRQQAEMAVMGGDRDRITGYSSIYD